MMEHLLTLTLAACSLLLAFSLFLCLLRLRRGPTIMDRILAFDTICTLIVGFMAVVSVRWDTALYLDLILVFTLLGFFSTVAFALYLHRTYDISHDRAEAPDQSGPRLTRRRRP
jgi:multisubunit Na+/H+ antiporter MnhF subunit